jgi:hypothetical protein
MSKVWLRVYQCPDCYHKWKCESVFGEPEPDCPACGFHPDPVPDRVCAPAIIGTKSKAVDEAYKIASEDYGLTNLCDNAHEGESAFIAPTMPAAPIQNIIGPNNRVAAAGGMMWGATPVNAPARAVPNREAIMVEARAAAAHQKATDSNPMTRLHRAKPVLNTHSVGNFNKR